MKGMGDWEFSLEIVWDLGVDTSLEAILTPVFDCIPTLNSDFAG